MKASLEIFSFSFYSRIRREAHAVFDTTMYNKINKFGAQRSGTYDSKVEKMVKERLMPLQEAGLISGLRRCNHHFLIIPEIADYVIVEKQLKTKVKQVEKKVVDERPAYYTPDFIFYDCETSEYVALEIKSFITKRLADYPLRRKLFKWKIREHNNLGRSQWRFDELVV